jgi:uncharacterized protein
MVDKMTREMARQVMVAAQGLDQPPPRPAGKADVLAAIRRMYLLQIDTIHVVARSPYLVLWSRLGDFDCDWLDELLAEGALFEGWAHAYCFIPIEDYPLHRRRAMDNMHRKGWPYSWPVKFLQDNPAVAEQVRAHLRENGAVRSAEFENKNKPPGGWWNWKAEKDALEAMLLTGEVMVARRHNFQRVYAPRERVLPGWDDAAAPPADEVQQALALRSVKALGVARPGWVADYFREPKKDVPGRLAALAGEGLLRRIEVEGFAGPAYVHPDNLAAGRRGRGRQAGTHADDTPVALRPAGLGPAAGAGAVRFRLHHRVLHPGRQAQVRLFQPAHPAPRPAGGAAGPQGPSGQGAVRGQGIASGAGR